MLFNRTTLSSTTSSRPVIPMPITSTTTSEPTSSPTSSQSRTSSQPISTTSATQTQTPTSVTQSGPSTTPLITFFSSNSVLISQTIVTISGHETTLAIGPTNETQTPTSDTKNNHLGMILGGVIGGVALVALVLLLVFLLCRRRQRRAALSNSEKDPMSPFTNGGISEVVPMTEGCFLLLCLFMNQLILILAVGHTNERRTSGSELSYVTAPHLSPALRKGQDVTESRENLIPRDIEPTTESAIAQRFNELTARIRMLEGKDVHGSDADGSGPPPGYNQMR
jgi:hypothetical protein